MCIHLHSCIGNVCCVVCMQITQYINVHVSIMVHMYYTYIVSNSPYLTTVSPMEKYNKYTAMKPPLGECLILQDVELEHC